MKVVPGQNHTREIESSIAGASDDLSRAVFEMPLTGKGLDPYSRFGLMLKQCQSDEDMRVLFSKLNSLMPLIKSYHNCEWSSVDHKIFASPPSSTALDSLSYFQILGFDLKVTEEGQVALIEVNGMNSGMKGFAATRSLSSGEATDVRRADRALDQYILRFGEAQLAYVGTELVLGGTSCNRLPGAQEIVDQRLREKLNFPSRGPSINIHPEWSDRYGKIASRIAAFENFCQSKSGLNSAFSQFPEFRKPSYPCTLRGAEDLVRLHNPEFIVVKPDNGMQGNSVSMIRAEQFDPARITSPDKMILEPFIKSRPIRSSVTGKAHDGCLRYVAVVEGNKADGSINIRHFGGYWRLSPLPISRYGELDAMRANLAQGALVEKASRGELDLMRESVERTIPALVISALMPLWTLERDPAVYKTVLARRRNQDAGAA